MNRTLDALIFFLIAIIAIPSTTLKAQSQFEIAFLPDVHFHDVLADFEEDGFPGLAVKYKGNQQTAAIRTMEAQLTSTRFFNENYFAFIAALDNITERGIKYVALPGDFSDDGQPVNVSKIAGILETYEEKYNLEFFVITGNHDPARPFAKEAGKNDFLGINDHPQPIYSPGHSLCKQNNGNLSSQSLSNQPGTNPVVCSNKIRQLGYEGIFELMQPYGLLPEKGDVIYYETPFSRDNASEDSLSFGNKSLSFANRQYEICSEGSGGKFKKSGYTSCRMVPDLSYLVEPIEGVWLLAIDANVYIPKTGGESSINFSSPSNAGYNEVLSHKKHLMEWIENVASRARAANKKLIAFSHYPAANFYDGARHQIEALWGKNEFQIQRSPLKNTSQQLARKGITFHVAGHMHMNDTGVVKDSVSGNVLTNIQVPSLAGYPAAYKIVRIPNDSHKIEVETITLDEVPAFDTFFSQYEKEWAYLDSIDYKNIWDRNILSSSSYREYVDGHLQELSRLRFFPEEWPEEIRIMLSNLSGRDMLTAAFLNSSLTFDNYRTWIKKNTREIKYITPDFRQHWNEAEQKASNFAKDNGMNLSDFDWNGKNLAADFYRLRNADKLAFRDIEKKRLNQYQLLTKAFSNVDLSHKKQEQTFSYVFKKNFKTIFSVMHKFSTALPTHHILVNPQTGHIENLEKNPEY